MRRIGMGLGLLCSGIASAGVLAVLVLAVLLVLACAGTAAGATWVVDCGGAGYVSTQVEAAA